MVDLLVAKLVENQIILESERAKYRYGVNALTVLFPGFILLLVIGIIMNELVFTLIFFFFFIVIRAFYPGIHAPSKLLCLIISCIIFIGCVVFKQNIFYNIPMDIGHISLILVCTIKQVVRIYTLPKVKDTNRIHKCLIVLFASEILFLFASALHWEVVRVAIFIAVHCNFVLFMLERTKQYYQKYIIIK